MTYSCSGVAIVIPAAGKLRVHLKDIWVQTLGSEMICSSTGKWVTWDMVHWRPWHFHECLANNKLSLLCHDNCIHLFCVPIKLLVVSGSAVQLFECVSLIKACTRRTCDLFQKIMFMRFLTGRLVDNNWYQK